MWLLIKISCLCRLGLTVDYFGENSTAPSTPWPTWSDSSPIEFFWLTATHSVSSWCHQDLRLRSGSSKQWRHSSYSSRCSLHSFCFVFWSCYSKLSKHHNPPPQLRKPLGWFFWHKQGQWWMKDCTKPNICWELLKICQYLHNICVAQCCLFFSEHNCCLLLCFRGVRCFSIENRILIPLPLVLLLSEFEIEKAWV